MTVTTKPAATIDTPLAAEEAAKGKTNLDQPAPNTETLPEVPMLPPMPARAVPETAEEPPPPTSQVLGSEHEHHFTVGERRYRVRDFWTTHLEFEAFRERFSLEYRNFEQLLLAEGVVERQEIVGAYYVNEGSDGDLAVPAES